MLHEVDCMLHVCVCLSVCLLLCMQGFGFVTFASSVSAESARLAMNGAVIEGRKIEVQQQFYLHTLLSQNNLLPFLCPSFSLSLS